MVVFEVGILNVCVVYIVFINGYSNVRLVSGRSD